MNATDFTFGIEIECYIPASVFTGNYMRGGYHRGAQCPCLPDGWNGQADGSLGDRDGFYAVEIVSPVLQGENGIDQVFAVVAKLREHGAVVDARCGFHVHVGCGNDLRNVRKIAALASNLEQGIYASSGTKNRERGHYCRKISDKYSKPRMFNSLNDLQMNLDGSGDRYFLLNLANFAFNGKPTVEFRAFSGTLNPIKMYGYISMAIGIVHRAFEMQKAASFFRKPTKFAGDVRSKGPGQDALEITFRTLQWKERFPMHFGIIKTSKTPTIKVVREKLRDLAEKYDAQP